MNFERKLCFSMIVNMVIIVISPAIWIKPLKIEDEILDKTYVEVQSVV